MLATSGSPAAETQSVIRHPQRNRSGVVHRRRSESRRGSADRRATQVRGARAAAAPVLGQDSARHMLTTPHTVGCRRPSRIGIAMRLRVRAAPAHHGQGLPGIVGGLSVGVPKELISRCPGPSRSGPVAARPSRAHFWCRLTQRCSRRARERGAPVRRLAPSRPIRK